jgi:hypothetical protein
MARLRLLLSLATALVLAPGGGLAQPAAEDVVNLGFCWRPGLTAKVTASSLRTQTGAPDRGSTFRYTLSVLKQGEQLRIRLDDPVADLSGARAPVSPEAQARVDEQLEGLLPDFLVTPEGKMVGLADLAGYQARLRAMIDRALPKTVDRAAAQKAIDAATSEAVLTARLHQQWQILVAAWLGVALPVGVEQTRHSKLGQPGQPGVAITHTFGATKRVPCQRGGTERQCVQLDLRSVPDQDSMNARMGQLTAALGKKLPATTRPKSVSVAETVQLIAEPECLIPHSFTRSQTQTVVLDHGDREETIQRVDRSAATYVFQ